MNMSSRIWVVSVFATIVFTLPFTTPVLGLQGASQEQNATAATNQKTVPADSTASPAGLKTEKENRSYALGMNVGEQVKSRSMDVDVDLIIRGLKDSISGSSTLLNEQEASVEVGEL